MLLPSTVLKCGRDDVFAEEGVCVHVCSHEIALPELLLKRYDHIPARGEQRRLFQVGIPELLLCSTPASFLMSFQHFWPLTRDEFQQAQRYMTVRFQRTELWGKEDFDGLQMYLKDQSNTPRAKEEKSALLAVLNDYTRYRIADVLEIWRGSLLDEVVIFKDPTQPPYLCDYPGLQRGFKRPPPSGLHGCGGSNQRQLCCRTTALPHSERRIEIVQSGPSFNGDQRCETAWCVKTSREHRCASPRYGEDYESCLRLSPDPVVFRAY